MREIIIPFKSLLPKYWNVMNKVESLGTEHLTYLLSSFDPGKKCLD